MSIKLSSSDGWKLAGQCGVDSGQIIMVDPCYVENGLDYEAACSATSKDELPYGKLLAAGVGGYGVVMSSGYGDGSYNVYVRFHDTGPWGSRVTAAIIDFDDDVEWDGEEDK